MGAFLASLVSRTLLLFLPNLLMRAIKRITLYFYNKRIMKDKLKDAEEKVKKYEEASVESAHDEFSRLP